MKAFIKRDFLSIRRPLKNAIIAMAAIWLLMGLFAMINGGIGNVDFN